MKVVSTSDGGLRYVSFLGLRSARFYPPTPARWRVVPVRGGLVRWHFPRMVLAVVRVGVMERLHAFEVGDRVEKIGPDTVLRPMVGGNSLSLDGMVCMGSDTRTFFGLRRNLVDRYWNTTFTMQSMTLTDNIASPRQFMRAGRIDRTEVLKHVIAAVGLVFGALVGTYLFFLLRALL